MLEGHPGSGVDRGEFLERFPVPVRLELEALDSKDSIDGGSRWSSAGASSAAGLSLHDLDFELLRGPEGVRLQNCGDNIGKALYTFNMLQIGQLPAELRPRGSVSGAGKS